MNRSLRAWAAIALIMGLLVACSGTDSSNDERPTSASSSDVSTTSPGTDTDGPASEEIIIAYSADVDLLDPHQFKSTSAFAVVGNIYGTLLQEEYADAGDGVLAYTGNSEPYLAESATWNDDQTTLTFTLRDDATFADGEAIAADDVVYSLQRAVSDISYGSAIGTWLNIVDAENSIVAVDDRTVELTVTHYSPLIEPFLAFPIFPVLDRSAAEAQATDEDPWSLAFFSQDATESGPYVIDSDVEGQSLTLRKNDAFTATDLSGAAETITIQNIPDPQQSFLALQNGAVDLVVGLPPDTATSVEEDPDLRLYSLPISDIVYLGFNEEDPVLQDVRVRQAISHLIPYDVLREEVMRGYAMPAHGATPYPMRDTLDESGDLGVAYPTDPEAARQLLEEAGIGEGELSLTLTVPSGEATFRQSAVFIQSALAEAGIAVEVNELSDAEFNSNLHQMQMFIDSWFSYGQDSVFQLFFLLTTGQFTNYTNYSNEDLDNLVAQAMATTDLDERHKLSQQAQRLVIDEAPWAFLFTREMLLGAKDGLEGVTNANDGNLRYHRLRFTG